jgi:hypothetical protein
VKKFLSIAVCLVYAIENANCQQIINSKETLRDIEWRHRIVGLWTTDTYNMYYGEQNVRLIVASDGSFASTQTIIKGNSKRELVLKGIWEINNGYLLQSITNTSDSKLSPLSTNETVKINLLNETNLVIVNPADGRQLITLNKCRLFTPR